MKSLQQYITEANSKELDSMKTSEVHISTIKPGDTIIHNGVLTTVSASNIKSGGFLGTTLFGDSYSAGHKKVKKVISF